MKSKISVIGCLFVFSAVLMLFASCGKDENDEPKNPGAGSGSGEMIEYYVKYACKVSGKVTNVKIMIVTEKGKQTLTVPNTWEGVFGPLDYLTTLVISGDGIGSDHTILAKSNASISICRGNQPFVLKADKSFKGTSFNVKYTVTKEDLK